MSIDSMDRIVIPDNSEELNRISLSIGALMGDVNGIANAVREVYHGDLLDTREGLRDQLQTTNHHLDGLVEEVSFLREDIKEGIDKLCAAIQSLSKSEGSK